MDHELDCPILLTDGNWCIINGKSSVQNAGKMRGPGEDDMILWPLLSE